MSTGAGGKGKAIGYAPFSREEMDLASKETLMKWCREYGLDDSGLKYELRLRLLEHVRRQNLLLKGEDAVKVAPSEPVEGDMRETGSEEVVVLKESKRKRERPSEVAVTPQRETLEIAGETPRGAETACPNCGQELTYISQYERWYCYSCQSYAPTTRPSAQARPVQRSRQRRAAGAVRISRRREGNPTVGISLAVLGLLMYVAHELLYNAPAIFDFPVLITAPEIGFALRFLSIVFISMGVIAAVLILRPRR